jgi:hypothetical protein
LKFDRFLWVTYQLEEICRQSRLYSDIGVRKALRVLPKTIEQTYARILVQIDLRDEDESTLAKKALLWVAFAGRRLSLTELWTAIAVEPRQLNSTDMPLASSPEVILDICTNLLNEIVSGTASEVQFTHFSVMEFLFPKDCTKIPAGLNEQQSKILHSYRTEPSEAHCTLGISCLTYLSYKDLGEFPDGLDRDELVAWFIAHNAHLISYATNFLAFHIENTHRIPSELLLLTQQFLQPGSSQLKFFIHAYHCYGIRGLHSDQDDLSLVYELYPVQLSRACDISITAQSTHLVYSSPLFMRWLNT